MKRIAITGGIGSGKSTVVKLFGELGIPSVDADAVARQVRDLPSVHADILKRFGTTDKSELRRIIIQDPQSKNDLEKILLPKIKEFSEKKMKAIEASYSAPFLLYEAILIIQSGRAGEFDGLIVVSASDEDRIKRIQERDQVSEEVAKSMLKAQMDREEWLKHADYTIENTGNLDQLRLNVKNLYSILK
jgi:dephospho-CoA kinase